MSSTNETENDVESNKEEEDSMKIRTPSISPNPTPIESNDMNEKLSDDDDEMTNSERERSRSYFSNKEPVAETQTNTETHEGENRSELTTTFLKEITSDAVKEQFTVLLSYLSDKIFFDLYYFKGSVSEAKHPLAVIRSRVLVALKKEWSHDREFIEAAIKLGSYDVIKILQQSQNRSLESDSPAEYVRDVVKDVAFPGKRRESRQNAKRQLDDDNIIIKKLKHDNSEFNKKLDNFLDKFYGDYTPNNTERIAAENKLKRLPEARSLEILATEIDEKDKISDKFNRAFATSKPTLHQQARWFAWDNKLGDDILERILSLPRSNTTQVVRSNLTTTAQVKSMLRRLEGGKQESIHEVLRKYANENNFTDAALQLINLIDCGTAYRIFSQKLSSEQVEDFVVQYTIPIEEGCKWADIGIVFQSDSLQVREIIPESPASLTTLKRHMAIIAVEKRCVFNYCDLERVFNNATGSITITATAE